MIYCENYEVVSVLKPSKHYNLLLETCSLKLVTFIYLYVSFKLQVISYNYIMPWPIPKIYARIRVIKNERTNKTNPITPAVILAFAVFSFSGAP